MKKSMLGSLLLLIFVLVFPTLAGVIISTQGITNVTQSYFIQGLSFALATIITLFIINKSRFSFKQIGFSPFRMEGWMFLILVMEIILFCVGWGGITDVSVSYIFVLLFFVTAVGICEELIFRGLIFNYLSSEGIVFAVIASSLLFAVGHLANLLSGAILLMSLIQLVYAFVFGVLCALMVIKTKSIYPVIIWHALHDFFALLTIKIEVFGWRFFLIVLIQILVLLIIGRYLWKKDFNSFEVS